MKAIADVCVSTLLLTALSMPVLSSAVVDPGALEARVAAPSTLTASVYPSYALAPAVVRVDASVDPSTENRELEMTVSSDNYYRSSTIELSGERAPRLHSVQFRGLPAGEYDVRVALTGTGGRQRAVVYRHLMVLE